MNTPTIRRLTPSCRHQLPRITPSAPLIFVEDTGIPVDKGEVIGHDMIMRDSGSGGYEIYDLGNNAILANYPLGQVGIAWQFIGLGEFDGADTSDMILQDGDTGALEVYDISNNLITWQRRSGRSGSTGSRLALAISPGTPTRPT